MLGAHQKKKTLPRSFRSTIAQASGLGKALYGSELLHTTNRQWKELRGPVGRALGYVGSGGSTMLALSVFEPHLDPQFANLVKTCRFWRCFTRIFPGFRTQFLAILHSSSAVCKSGPAQALRKTLGAVGIAPQGGDLLVLDQGLHCHWLTDSWGALHIFIGCLGAGTFVLHSVTGRTLAWQVLILGLVARASRV